MKERIVVVIKGGCLVAAFGNKNTEVVLVDWDENPFEGAKIFPVDDINEIGYSVKEVLDDFDGEGGVKC